MTRFLFLLVLLPWPAAAQLVFSQIHREPYSFIQMGDIHAGAGNSAGGSSSLVGFTNSINVILSNRVTWNIKAFFTPGDVYEQETNAVLTATNITTSELPALLKQIQTNGITVFPCPGNHDCDDSTANVFWTNQFPVTWFTNDPSYVGTWTNGDTRELIFRQTNSGMKWIFTNYRWRGTEAGSGNSDAEVISNYAAATLWISNTFAQFPDHHAIVLAHYFVNAQGALGLEDNDGSYPHVGPGIAAWTNALDRLANVELLLCGHVRTTATTITQVPALDGHRVTIIKYNTQAAIFRNYGLNGGSFKLFTVVPDERRVHIQTYDAILGRFLTNGEWGFTHEAYVPLKSL